MVSYTMETARSFRITIFAQMSSLQGRERGSAFLKRRLP